MKWIIAAALSFLTISQAMSVPVNFKMDFCACKDGLPVSFGNCNSFCAGTQTNGAEILYSSFTVKPNTSLNTVYKWCTSARPRIPMNPKCVLKATNGSSSISMDVDFKAENDLTFNVSALRYDATYLLQLVELSTGAKSDKIQFIKYKN